MLLSLDVSPFPVNTPIILSYMMTSNPNSPLVIFYKERHNHTHAHTHKYVQWRDGVPVSLISPITRF